MLNTLFVSSLVHSSGGCWTRGQVSANRIYWNVTIKFSDWFGPWDKCAFSVRLSKLIKYLWSSTFENRVRWPLSAQSSVCRFLNYQIFSFSLFRRWWSRDARRDCLLMLISYSQRLTVSGWNRHLEVSCRLQIRTPNDFTILLRLIKDLLIILRFDKRSFLFSGQKTAE